MCLAFSVPATPPIKSVPLRNTSSATVRSPCVPIEDQFRCQASMCHLDVFTAVRIIHATLWVCWYKPSHEKRASEREKERERKWERGRKSERRKKVECTRKTRVDRLPAATREMCWREKPSVYTHNPRERRHSLFKTLWLLSLFAFFLADYATIVVPVTRRKRKNKFWRKLV